jgi:hypothetical protein
VKLFHRYLPVAVIVAGLSVGATTAGTSEVTTQARGGDVSAADAGTLTFDAQLDVRYPSTTCPPGTPGGVECYARTGSGIIRGLGTVNESYAYGVDPAPAGCGVDRVALLPTTARLSVPGKGEIELSIAGAACVPRVAPQPLRAKAAFTIIGGSGRYTGASGGGTYTDLSYGPPGFRGRDTWTGMLVVPGLDFDLTAPVLRGAVAKSVRAPKGKKSTRVVYRVTAADDVDGALPAHCLPRSGSQFRLGRTTVRCSATDKSANTATRTFTVRVVAAG